MVFSKNGNGNFKDKDKHSILEKKEKLNHGENKSPGCLKTGQYRTLQGYGGLQVTQFQPDWEGLSTGDSINQAIAQFFVRTSLTISEGWGVLGLSPFLLGPTRNARKQ